MSSVVARIRNGLVGSAGFPVIPIAKHIAKILKLLGEDVDRPGLNRTPERVAKAYRELFEGYRQDPNDHVKIFEEIAADEMIVSSGIRIQSFCEHHMLPFIGSATVAYIPSRVDELHNPPVQLTLIKTVDETEPSYKYKILGISKITRIVNVFAHRLQIQERLTQQIANFIMDCKLNPLGVGVVIKADHMCMSLRGVKDSGSQMKTSCLLGVFKQPEVRQEFLKLG